MRTMVFSARALLGVALTRADMPTSTISGLFVLCWMPAVSLYFRDPDGHLLEYLAMLPDEPRPDLTVVSYKEWVAMRGA